MNLIISPKDASSRLDLGKYQRDLKYPVKKGLYKLRKFEVYTLKILAEHIDIIIHVDRTTQIKSFQKTT